MDGNLGPHIFQEAVLRLGAGGGRCVVMSTHQAHRYVDGAGIGPEPGGGYCGNLGRECECVVMEGGRVKRAGSYLECAEAGGDPGDTALALQDDDDGGKGGGEAVADSGGNETHGGEPLDVMAGVDDAATVIVKDDAHKEGRDTGLIKRSTWIAYANALGGVWVGVLLLAFFILTQVSSLVTMVAMGKWSERSPDDQVSPRTTK